MDQFNSAIEQGLNCASDVIGEPISYKGKEVKAIFSEIETSIDAEIYGDKSETYAEVVIASGEVRPKRGDELTRQGKKYKVSTFNHSAGYYEIRAKLIDA